MEAVKDVSHLYEVEHRAYHAARPGFRITSATVLVLQGIGEYDFVPLT